MSFDASAGLGRWGGFHDRKRPSREIHDRPTVIVTCSVAAPNDERLDSAADSDLFQVRHCLRFRGLRIRVDHFLARRSPNGDGVDRVDRAAFNVRSRLDRTAAGPDHELVDAISIEIESKLLMSPTCRSEDGG